MRLAAHYDLVNADWQAKADALNASATPGKAKVYSGPVPDRGVTPDGDLMLTYTLQQPCEASIAGGILTMKPVLFAQVQASGSPTLVRLENGDGDFVMDCDAGQEGVLLPDGSLPAFRFDQSAYAAGEYVQPLTIEFRDTD